MQPVLVVKNTKKYDIEKMLISFVGRLIGPAVNIIIAHDEEKNTCVKQQCEINFVPPFGFEWLKQDYC